MSEQVRMLYSQYKKHYADCKTVPGTYDEVERTITVILPDGRIKPSGVRGKSFHRYDLWLIDEFGKECTCGYRAVCRDNAWKLHVKWCKENGCTPIEPPKGKTENVMM